MDNIEGYIKYRGKCKELAEQAVEQDITLTLVRGHYWCPFWGLQPHWWCVTPDGDVYDPTAAQFPSNGEGDYIPFNGIVECSQCGKETSESEAYLHGNYALCSLECQFRFVGL